MYNHLRTSVDNWLAEHCLLYHETLPLTTLVKSIVKGVETKMKDSPLAYHIQPLRSAFADHESLPLKLLGVVSRGIARANGLVVLRPKPFTAATTLLDLITNKTTFAATSCLDSDTNCWMMFLGEIILMFSCSISDPGYF
jgi:hypothetical protein